MGVGIIEIIGPPGVGKTTIYDSLCRNWRPADSWTYPGALLTPVPSFSAFRDWISYQIKKRLGRKPPKNIQPEHGLRFIKDNPLLGEFLWDLLSDQQVYPGDEVNKRFRASYFLFSDFCQYQAVLEKKSTRYCIINEGLLQKSFLVHEDRFLMQEVVKRYASVLQFPSAIVCINVEDNALILKRIRQRKKVIASHIGKNDEALLSDIANWQYYLELIIKEAAERKVPVFKVNAERPVNENIELIRRKLGEKQFTVMAGYQSPALVNE
jgi:deoxyadenosine/deoxycytidine kinase